MKFFHVIAAASLAILIALLWQFSPQSKPTKSDSSSETESSRFVVRDVRVFDGERVWPKAQVRVRDGLIESIDAEAEVPAGYQVIDGKQHTLMPGLIDAHVHTWGAARADALRFGVTTMLDMFSDHHALSDARKQRESNDATNEADLWSAGTLATAAGGHGTQFGMEIPTLSSPDQASAWVAARKQEGSDYIKIVREDLSAYTTNRRMPTLDDATAAALIEAAHAQGLRAVVHVSTMEHARAAIRDGADGLVHVFQDQVIDEDLLALAKERDVFVIPTLTVVSGMSGESSELIHDTSLSGWLSATQRQTLQARFGFGEPDTSLIRIARENVRKLRDAGVSILAGTDAPNAQTAHGVSIHEELSHLVRAGQTPAQALASATSLPARHFGLTDRGRIAAGLRADMVLVRGAPDEDVGATRAIVSIWKNGRMIDREAAQVASATRWDAGLVSHFDGESLDSSIGMGWTSTADTLAGGRSEAHIERVASGAQGSAGAMRVHGEVRSGSSLAWAGAMLHPGAALMQPVDASALSEIVFMARGDGRDYALLLFSGEAMGPPAMRAFTAHESWQEVRMPFEQFSGVNLAQLSAIGITAGMPAGEFWVEIDSVEIH